MVLTAAGPSKPSTPAKKSPCCISYWTVTWPYGGPSQPVMSMMLAAPEFTTLTLSTANASARASGLSESKSPAHDCAADRAAASDAFTIARRL